ncbi:MAG: insulinase family protein [Patescibacteria group bacterium]|nr:insulinase family protein [Patescibacteria group bacterium]
MKYIRQTLANGVRLIFTPMPQSLSVGVNVFVGTGSRNEAAQINGISHFLEHLVFKGTKKYENSRIISESIEGLGGMINAYTSDSLTNFHARVTPPHFEEAFRVVASLVLEPLLRPKDIDAEKGVIIEEINRKEDDPQDKVFEHIARLTFPNHPLGRPTLGSSEVIRSLSQKDFLDYRAENYVSQNTVVSIAGNISEDRAVTMFENKFSSLTKNSSSPLNKFFAVQLEPQVFLEKKETEQAHFCLSLRGLSLFDERRYALAVLNSILGAGMSSRLFLNIREKGLAYSVGSLPDLLVDTGALYVFAGFSVSRINEALAAVMGELKRLKEEQVGEEELKKALEKIKGPLYFELEDPAAVGDWYGKQEVMKGEIETEEEYLKSLTAVTPKDVRGLANDLLDKRNLNLAIIGPYKEEKKAELLKLLKF